MTLTLRTAAIAFLMSFLWVEVSQAGLLRSSGRRTLSRNFDLGFYFVEDRFLNDIGIKPDMTGDLPITTGIFRGVGGGAAGVSAVPNDCTAGGYGELEQENLLFELDDLEQRFNDGLIGEEFYDSELARIDFELNGEPCSWEFEQGEVPFTFGAFSLFFDTPLVTYDVFWDVRNRAGDSTRFDGSINPAERPVPGEPGFTIDKGWVQMNAAAPLSLAPGDYTITASVQLNVTGGQLFWDSTEPGNEIELQRICEFNPAYDEFFANPDNFDENGSLLPGLVEPDIEICGFNSVDTFSSTDAVLSAPTFFRSIPETFSVLPRQEDPTASVSSPATLGSLLLGLGLMSRLRRAPRRVT